MASTLIISEKAIAARRIAEILSKGKAKAGKRGSVPVYRFASNGDEFVSVGLKGHILKVDFSEEYARWSRKKLEELIDAPIVKVPSEPEIIAALVKEAKGRDRIIIATDFDREGELIGADALAQVRDVAPDAEVYRARFSALTNQEVTEAFDNLEEPYVSLAEAGAARQDIDLIWGAVLTRYLSLVASKRGHDFLSAGRVQTPTLVLIVQRELERRAFDPVPFWTIDGSFEADGHGFSAGHATDRFFDEAEARGAMERVDGATTGTVSSVDINKRRPKPPAPFNTTSLMAAAASTGLSPKRTMDIAESLYMNGLISYPRTDNTVYPPSLDLAGLTQKLTDVPFLAEHARAVLAQPKLTPTRGAKQTTDHPPVHPTGVPNLSSLRDDQKKVYELVARRFLATLSPPAEIDSKKVRVEVAGEPFVASGQRVVVEGWLAVYPYTRQKDKELPALTEDQQVVFGGATLQAKETKPPARYSQGVLIQEMEKIGLGTKATRHDIIQTLLDRGYVVGEPLAPTRIGDAVAAVMEEFGGSIASPEMTAVLESAMDEIVAGDTEREGAVARSREGLHEVMNGLIGDWDEVRAKILKALTDGACPQCGLPMLIRSSRRGGRFVGCTGYPDCTQTYPLPDRGRIEPRLKPEEELKDADDEFMPCETCSAPVIFHRPPRSRDVAEKCVNPACPTNEEPDVDVGACPNCKDRLMLIRSKRTGKRFVRCSNYERENDPCETSYPVPQSGEITATGEVCDPCGSPRIVVQTRRGPWEICLDPDCTTKTEKKKRKGKGGKTRKRATGSAARKGG